MLKRPIDEFEKQSNEFCVSTSSPILINHSYQNHFNKNDETSSPQYCDDISEPATKLIKIEEHKINDQSQYSDKCIQVDSDECKTLLESVVNEIDSNCEDSECNETSENSQVDVNNDNNAIKENCESIKCQNEENQALSLVHQENSISDETFTSEQTVDSNECENNCQISELLNENDVSTEIEFNDETSSSSSGILSIANSLDDSTTTSSIGSEAERNGPLRSLLKVAGRKPKLKKKVIFNNVTVFYFKRSQGFTCVPSQGGSTLGMENTHSYLRNFTLETHAEERKRAHREILLRQKRFAKINKQSSTSESEDESYDEFSDLSDIDLENDSCYFLQPMPIKQRRALLRASGVRKIETTEKEECRDIRISREFCGCDCRVYCNPDVCSCHQAGIKCQVDRMSFPCGCTREGCANSNGRIEFNPLRVRTHFIHTIMRLEMEKGNEDLTDHNLNINQSHQKENGYLPANNATGVYDPNSLSSECNPMLQSPNTLYMPMQNVHYVTTEPSSHMVLTDSNNSFMNTNCINMFQNDYSPDNSSYSENSDYTSDDFEEDYCHNNEKEQNDHPPQQQQPVYSHQGNYAQEMLHSMPTTSALSLSNTNTSSSTSSSSSPSSSSSNTILSQFPSISCDLAANDFNKQQNHCHSYQSSSHLHLNSYDSFASMAEPQSTIYSSYDMTNAVSYNYEFHQSDLGVNLDGNSFITTNITNEPQIQDNQQYIDLSLSIASSSSAESILSAANNSDEDTRLTPVTFNNIPTNLYAAMNERPNQALCSQPPYNPSYTISKMPYNINNTRQGDLAKNVQDVVDSTTNSLSSDKNLSANDNFGEIIKKSIVESVTA